MGELLAFYQIADIAFVGGSLVDTGCQHHPNPSPMAFPPYLAFPPIILPPPVKQPWAGAAQQILSAQAWRHTVED